MELNIGLHTVILLTGPSQSGKSTWANHFKNKITKLDDKLHTAIISSDDIRHEILGENLHRYDPRMSEVSEAAFELLFEKLKASIRFPVNNEFVIVDTTGLDTDFRYKVTAMAKEFNYRTAIVMFDYPTGEYFSALNGHERTIVAKHVDTFKKKVLPTIKRKHYDYSLTVKSKDAKFFDDLEVNVEDYVLWRKSHLFPSDMKNKKAPLAIIGDIHEHIDALKLMLDKIPADAQLVFVGDLFDKGNQTKEMLPIAEELIAKGAIIVRGNHESFVARRLKGEIEAVAIEKDFFPSLAVFQSDKELADRFLKIYEKTLPFLCVHTYGKSIYVTHAPCYNKTLGKMDEKSQKYQRNFYFSSRDPEQMEKELEFISKEAKYSHPLHVFGHVAHDLKNIVDKNKYWLDTGAVYGNKLSALVIYPGGDTKLITQDVSALTSGHLFGTRHKKVDGDVKETIIMNTNTMDNNLSVVIPLLSPGNPNKEDSSSLIDKNESDKSNKRNQIEELAAKYNLSPEDKYWLHSFEESDAKFISGTMSPSRSTRTLLEPIDTALQYFQSKDVKDIIIEPKYMGSRLQLYLHRDKTKDFAITRSGAKAGNKEMLQSIFDTWHEKLDKEDFWKDSLVLDGELLPWSAIGKELIEKEFIQYGKSIEKEWELLSSDKNFNKFAIQIGIDIPSETKGIETFMKQVEMYGADYPVEYKPFSVLSVDNNLWVMKNQEEIFKWLLPLEKYKVIHLEDENALEEAQNFFKELTLELNNKGFSHEGVVVKPLVYKEGVAPYMKVRNENYLHIIYGYDYLKKYQEKVSNKKIGRKLELSIKEYELGMQMLISKDKRERLELACQLKFQINLEKGLDSRL